jgi:hypothetical protein
MSAQTAGHAMANDSGQLVVRVLPQQEMEQQGQDLILQIRLASGATASLWTDAKCKQPPTDAYSVSQSGKYTIPIPRLGAPTKPLVCLYSSDEALKGSLQLK